MKKRRLFFPRRCLFCGIDEETINHTFIYYLFSKSLWCFFGDCFKRKLDLSNSFEVRLLQVVKENFSMQIKLLLACRHPYGLLVDLVKSKRDNFRKQKAKIELFESLARGIYERSR